MRFSVKRFSLLELHLEGVGPFQEKTHSFKFRDPDNEPTNLYVILGANGLGKTTILESIAFLLSLLDGLPSTIPVPEWLEDLPGAKLQLDVLIEVFDGVANTMGVLSLVYSRGDGAVELRHWLSDDLSQRDAQWWARSGCGNVGAQWGDYAQAWSISDPENVRDDDALRVVDRLREHISAAKSAPSRREILDTFEDAPTILLFTAHRDLTIRDAKQIRTLGRPADWSHALVHRFDAELGLWSASLDHLLVWLDYLDGKDRPGLGTGMFARACNLVNKYVFGDREEGPRKRLSRVDRDRMEAVVECTYPDESPFEHRVDRLSGGERSLAQIFVRIAAHMTANTLVLIDEADLHLHPAWERGLVWSFKEFVRDYPGMNIIFTTHSKEMLAVFDAKQVEDGLRKGGHIVETRDFDQNRRAEG